MGQNIGHSTRPRIVVIGGGAAGLACGFALAERRAEVIVLESGEIGRGALWASAGMLAPDFEAGAELDPAHSLAGSLHAFGQSGAALWADWSVRLEALSGVPVHRRAGGSLTPLLDDEDAARFDAAVGAARALGATVRELDSREAAALEPGLAPVQRAALYETDAHLDNRALPAAFAGAIAALGGVVRPHARVLEILERSGRAAGVRLETGERIEADAVVLATGLGSALHPAASPLTPVKGQMAAFALTPGAAPGRLIRGFGGYLAPKPDRVLVGATSEPGEGGLDTGPALDALIARTKRMWPALASAREIERWSGLRPASADRMPVLGRSRLPGLVLALGGYRNGVLLAPAMGEAVAAAILEGRVPARAAPFRPDRTGLAGKRASGWAGGVAAGRG